MSNLIEGTDQLIKNRETYLKDAIRARELLEFLPEEILAMQGEVDYNKWSDEEDLRIRVYGKDAVDILKRNGVQGLTYKVIGSSYFSAEGGRAVLSNGMTAYFEAWSVEKPRNCILEEVPTIAYKIVCAESNE